MAVYRSFRNLITQTQKTHLSITFFSLSLSSPSPLPRFLSPLSPLSRFLSPLSRAPLFLSSPPCMLSQSSTPIYAQSDVVLLSPKVQCLNYLLRSRHLQSLEILNRSIGAESSDGERRVGSRSEELDGGFINLPNMISIGRLVSGPFLGWMIVNEMYLPAFIGLGISGASDWLDGFVARRMGINSLVGSYLDPLADKVLIGCVAVAMVEKGLLHPGLVALVVLRDVGLVGGAFYKRASSLDWNWKNWSEFFNIDGMRPEKVEPLFLSKVNTVFQLALVAAALLQPEFGTPETQPYITYLSWLVASTTVATSASYGVLYMKNRPFRGKR